MVYGFALFRISRTGTYTAGHARVMVFGVGAVSHNVALSPQPWGLRVQLELRPVCHRHSCSSHRRPQTPPSTEVRFCSVVRKQQMSATVCNHQRRVNRHQTCRSAWRRGPRRPQPTSSATVSTTRAQGSGSASSSMARQTCFVIVPWQVRTSLIAVAACKTRPFRPRL